MDVGAASVAFSESFVGGPKSTVALPAAGSMGTVFFAAFAAGSAAAAPLGVASTFWTGAGKSTVAPSAPRSIGTVLLFALVVEPSRSDVSTEWGIVVGIAAGNSNVAPMSAVAAFGYAPARLAGSEPNAPPHAGHIARAGTVC